MRIARTLHQLLTRKSPPRARVRRGGFVAALLVGLLAAAPASAYIGPSYLQLPDVPGGWAGAPFKNWIRVNSNYWRPGRSQVAFVFYQLYGGPPAPRQGPGELAVAIDKRSPAVRRLLKKCLDKTPIADMTYAESSAMAGRSEVGERPPQMPEYFHYKLSGVQVSECPVVAGAAEQAFVFRYTGIQWLNYDQAPGGIPPVLSPVPIQPAPEGPRTRSFVVTWFGVAKDAADDQCTAMATKPAPDQYFTYLSKEDAEKERARLVPLGGPGNVQMGQRGPDKLDVTRLPGIVPDPGQPLPRKDVARGLSLDGRSAVNNRFYEAIGCIPGYLGHKGFLPQFSNSQMRDGEYSMLLQLSDVDDFRNDDSIEISWFYSTDPIVKNAAGNAVLRDYSFRVTDKPQFAHYFARQHARIVNGVIIADPIRHIEVYAGKQALPAVKRFSDAQLRLQLLPDGGIKGLLGGYVDLWVEANRFTNPLGELNYNFQAPAAYYALMRAADGMKDPVTHVYNGISVAYDVEGLPAFIATKNPAKMAVK